MSARGGTTGRAAGCPTKFGFAGGRRGLPPPIPPPPGICPSGGGAAAPGVGLATGRGGVGIVGTAVPGRGAPGAVIMVGGPGCAAGGGWIEGAGAALIPGAGLGVSARVCGIGWRGPDKICPGLGGGGAEREGITGPRLGAGAGAPGWPVANGGRNGNAGRTGAGASSLSAGTVAAGRAVSGAAAAGALFEADGPVPVGRDSGERDGCSGAAVSGCSLSSGAPVPVTRRRRFSTTSSSSELEWVFFSVTPNSGNNSRMTFGLTSSSRASSLMRILLIRKTLERTTRYSRD